MKANKNVFVNARVDKETKEWMEKHPLSHSQLINYGLYLIRMIESNLKEANAFVTSVSIEPKEGEKLPF